jgi:hypothetical protein
MHAVGVAGGGDGPSAYLSWCGAVCESLQDVLERGIGDDQGWDKGRVDVGAGLGGMEVYEVVDGGSSWVSERESLQDSGFPGNAPEDQVMVNSGSSLVGGWHGGARSGGGAAVRKEVIWSVVMSPSRKYRRRTTTWQMRLREALVSARVLAGRATGSATAHLRAWATPAVEPHTAAARTLSTAIWTA